VETLHHPLLARRHVIQFLACLYCCGLSVSKSGCQLGLRTNNVAAPDIGCIAVDTRELQVGMIVADRSLALFEHPKAEARRHRQ
jgi:hypothetical protein